MRFRHGEATDVGQVRQINEDAYLVAEPLFAVADGMGGHQAGEVASATAVEALRASVSELSADALMAGVEQANLEVFRRASQDSSLRGMGTTLCAIAPVVDGAGERIGIVNVGDSRIYVHTADGLTQVTEDHSLVETMVRVGQLTPEQAAGHPKRNVVTRALGIEPTVDVDCWALTPAPGDRLLLCSDGLFGEVDDATISEVLAREADPTSVAEELVRLANAAGGRDNITVVVVDIEPDGPAADAAAVPLGARVERLSTPADDLELLGEPDDDLAQHPDPPSPYLPPEPLSSRESDQKQVESPRQKGLGSPRVTWRVLVFVCVVLVVVGVAVGAVVLSNNENPSPTTVPAPTTSIAPASSTAPNSVGTDSSGSPSSTSGAPDALPTVSGG